MLQKALFLPEGFVLHSDIEVSPSQSPLLLALDRNEASLQYAIRSPDRI